MPLTRNLYREDEVLSALQFCILKGRMKESIFWAHELVSSNMTCELLQRLFWIWMNFFGSSHLSWYSWFHDTTADLENVNEEAIYLLVASLGKATVNKRHDSTVFALLLSGLARVPTDRIGFAILPVNLRELQGVKKAFATAVKQGKLELAWSLWPSNAWQVLGELSEVYSPIIQALSVEHTKPLWKTEWTWPIKALALVIAGSLSRPVSLESEMMPVELVNCWNEWGLGHKMREARWATIPYESLHWFTGRTASTEIELTRDLEKALPGSNFWDDLLSIDREEFFDTYFTSDIPDEWSSADRQKSHGPGPTPTTCERTFSRWFQGIPSKGLWSGIETAIKYMAENWEKPVNIETAIHDEYEMKNLSRDVSMLNIEPVKYRFEVCAV